MSQMQMTTYGWMAVACVCSPIAVALGAMVVEAGKTAYYRWVYRRIPGPTPGIIGGNLMEIKRMGGFNFAIQKWHEQHGPIFKVFLLGQMLVVAADAAAARVALSKMSDRAPLMQPLFFLAQGLRKRQLDMVMFVANGSLWRTLRNAWQPTFSPACLAAYTGPMHTAVDDLCDVLAKPYTKAGGGSSAVPSEANMYDLFKCMALNVVGTCAYGVKFNAFADGSAPGASEENRRSQALVKAAGDLGATGMTTPTTWSLIYAALPNLHPLIVQLARLFPDVALTTVNKGFDDTISYAKTLVSDFRKQTTSAHGSGTTTASAGANERDSFLARIVKAQDKLIAAGQLPVSDQLDDNCLAAQATGFIIGGSETSSSTMAFTMYLIATHPEVEARLMQEIEAHCGLDKPPTVEELTKFTYLDAVLNESMRVLPAVHTLVRDLSAGVETITVSGHKLPRGINVVVPMYSLHRDPKVWGARATEFIPGRWLPKEHPDHVSEPVDLNSFMPFGGGARMCPGMKFAMQEVRLTLVTLYQRFRFELSPGQVPLELKAGTSLQPKHGVMMKATPRNSKLQAVLGDATGTAGDIPAVYTV